MAGRRIEIHPVALAELKSAVEWYLERSEPAAQDPVAAVDHAIALVIECTKTLAGRGHDTRRFVLQRFPFTVTCREKDSGAQMLAFAHGHRRPGYWKERL